MSAAPSRDLLTRLPKAELHCHLDGSVRASTLLDLAAEQDATMPRATAAELADYMLVRDARSLEDYLARFEVTLSVLQTEAALERVAYELAVDAAAEGVRYLEIRYCPTLNQRRGLDLGATIEAPLRGLDRAERETGIIARTIVTALRGNPPAESQRMAQLAAEYRARGVVGFDLAGGEMGFPASAHEKAFLLAREQDMACTCHAGEGDGAQSVREAVHRCGAHRIGHATRLIEDPELVEFIADRQIALEICLTSNVQTRVASSYEVHPFRRYFDEGLNVVLNTDNRLMSGVSLTDEYMAAATHLAFTMDELCDVALNGFQSAFLPWKERQALLDRVTPEIDALRAFAV